jgi:hypothetical protein
LRMAPPSGSALRHRFNRFRAESQANGAQVAGHVTLSASAARAITGTASDVQQCQHSFLHEYVCIFASHLTSRYNSLRRP